MTTKKARRDATKAKRKTKADIAIGVAVDVIKTVISGKKTAIEPGKPADKKPDRTPKNEVIDARHEFTPDEMLALGQELAQICEQIEADEQHIKDVAKDLKSQLGVKVAKRASLQSKINSKGEDRPAECRVELDAKHGVKRYYRLTDAKMVKSCAMSATDYQLTLNIKDPDVPPDVQAQRDKEAAEKAAANAAQAPAIGQNVGAAIEQAQANKAPHTPDPTDNDKDPDLLKKAAAYVKTLKAHEEVNCSTLQRALTISYSRAREMFELLAEKKHIERVSNHDGEPKAKVTAEPPI